MRRQLSCQVSSGAEEPRPLQSWGLVGRVRSMTPAGLGPSPSWSLSGWTASSQILRGRRGRGLGLSPWGTPDAGSAWELEGWVAGVCLGRRLTIKVYSAVPIEVHISEHLVQLRTHQRLPQQSRCSLLQLCHCDSSIPVPVKLGSLKVSASLTHDGTISTYSRAALECPHH